MVFVLSVVFFAEGRGWKNKESVFREYFFMAGTAPGAGVVSCSTPPPLWGGCFYHPHFINEKMEPQRCILLEVNGRERI